MIKVFIFLILNILILTMNPTSSHALGKGSFCKIGEVVQGTCDPPLVCLKDPNPGPGLWLCQESPLGVLGKIVPPSQIQNLGFGAEGISNILNRGIELLFIVAGIIFVFMIVISAVQWIVSGGDKEGIGKARGRLTAAIVGIVLLSLAFVIIRVVGQITGFEFFAGQNNPPPQPTPVPDSRRIDPLYYKLFER